MSAIQGKEFIVSVEDVAQPAVLSTIGGQRHVAFRLRPGGGRPTEIEVHGLRYQSHAVACVAALAAASRKAAYRVEAGNGDVWSGEFAVAEYDLFDDPDVIAGTGPEHYRLLLESAGPVTLTQNT